EDGSLHVWTREEDKDWIAATPKSIKSAHQRMITAVEAAGGTIVSSSSDGKVHVWAVPPGDKPARTIEARTGGRCLAAAGVGRRQAAGGGRGGRQGAAVHAGRRQGGKGADGPVGLGAGGGAVSGRQAGGCGRRGRQTVGVGRGGGHEEVRRAGTAAARAEGG